MSRPRPAVVATCVAAWSLLAVVACAAEPAGPPGGDASDKTITVFAAASLKNTFTALGAELQRNQPDVRVRFNFAGSADLVTQLQAGAAADVFASADRRNMDRAADDDLLQAAPTTFASNTLQIAVPPDNPAKIAGFADLAAPGVNVVVCAPAVPCGFATDQVERATGIALRPVSEESSVTDVLNKVISGEADAGLVYLTDVRAAGDKVSGITFPEAGEAVNEYPIAVLAGSRRPELARQFVELVSGPTGRRVLADAGFGRP